MKLKRWLMPVAGIVLIAAALVGLMAFNKLLGVLTQTDASQRVWLDYGLIGVALASIAIAGISLIYSWITQRQTDVVPGPALYLFGAALMMLGGQAAVLGDPLPGAIAMLLGALVVWLEYRSDWL